MDWAILADEEIPEGSTEETPAGVASRSSRRRGGRRRHGNQRDGETTDGTEDNADDVDATDADDEVDSEEVVPVFADSLEETAATDFDLPDDDEADNLEAEPAQPAGEEEPTAWFDIDEEVGAGAEFVVEQPPEQAPESYPVPEPATNAAGAEDVFGQ